MKPHRARVLAMQAIFQLEFQSRDLEDILRFDWIDYQIPDDEAQFAGKLIKGVVKHSDIINKVIAQYSENWKMERISAVNKSILRVAIYQMKFMPKEIPPRVAIDEAIRLSKKYGESDSSRFINGILDAVHKDEGDQGSQDG